MNYLYNVESIKDLRYFLNKTQVKLSKELNVTQAFISQIETYKRFGDLDFYLKIKKMYNLDADMILNIMENHWLKCTKKNKNI